VVTWPLAPDPPCEQVLAAVGVGCWALASPILRHRPVPCPPSSWPSRTRRPPYEQLLIGVARGSYAWGVIFCSPPSSCPRRLIGTHNPPYEQWLVGMGVDAVRCCALFVVVVPVSRGESVTWQGYGWALVRISRVSPSRGLPAPLPDILSLTETLTSRMGRRGSAGACGCGSCRRCQYRS
jgi:hypothetical protein